MNVVARAATFETTREGQAFIDMWQSWITFMATPEDMRPVAPSAEASFFEFLGQAGPARALEETDVLHATFADELFGSRRYGAAKARFAAQPIATTLPAAPTRISTPSAVTRSIFRTEQPRLPTTTFAPQISPTVNVIQPEKTQPATQVSRFTSSANLRIPRTTSVITSLKKPGGYAI